MSLRWSSSAMSACVGASRCRSEYSPVRSASMSRVAGRASTHCACRLAVGCSTAIGRAARGTRCSCRSPAARTGPPRPTRAGQSPGRMSAGGRRLSTDRVALATGETARSVGDLLGGDDRVAVERLHGRLAVARASTTAATTARGTAAAASGSHGETRRARGRGAEAVRGTVEERALATLQLEVCPTSAGRGWATRVDGRNESRCTAGSTFDARVQLRQLDETRGYRHGRVPEAIRSATIRCC